jgi:hypothetical protein
MDILTKVFFAAAVFLLVTGLAFGQLGYSDAKCITTPCTGTVMGCTLSSSAVGACTPYDTYFCPTPGGVSTCYGTYANGGACTIGTYQCR